jgi:hypothetical protein
MVETPDLRAIFPLRKPMKPASCAASRTVTSRYIWLERTTNAWISTP